MNAARVLLVSLLLAVLDTGYLSWRFVALRAGWVEPGTGLCSWTAWIDCDQVLQTSQARAFHVPNAILGWGFFFGCLLWWLWSRRLAPEHRPFMDRLLAFWLGVATLFTAYFWWLLVHLDHLCPFCPWNHLWTWVAFGAAVVLWRGGREHEVRPPGSVLWPPIAICVGQFWLWQLAWVTLQG